MPSLQKILGFFVFTAVGSSLSSLATFLSIETYFHSIKYLGIALCLRTLSSGIFGYQSNRIIQKLGLHDSFLLSQSLGFLSIIVIFCGFHYQEFSIVLCGLILIGLPLTFSTILLTIAFKIGVDEDGLYRKYSGSRELIFGFSRLSACLLVPLLMFEFNLNTILVINAAAYLIGGLFLFRSDLKSISKENFSKPAIKINHLILMSKNTWVYVCQTTSSFLLAAFIPILASSENMELTKKLSPMLRQSLWSIEAVTMILSSILYLFAKRFRESKAVKTVLMLNGIFLTLLLLSTQTAVVMSVIVLVSISMMLAFYIFRDDYVIHAGADLRLIEAHAAFSSVQKDLIFSVSPVILTYIFANFGLNIAIISLLFLQVFLYVVCQVIQKNDVKIYQVEQRA
jgi:hypothetical protein